MSGRTDPEVDTDDREIQQEILSYLAASPLAEATWEGIVEWWVMERAIERESARVERALAALVAAGLLRRERTTEGATLYRLVPGRGNEPSLPHRPHQEKDR